MILLYVSVTLRLLEVPNHQILTFVINKGLMPTTNRSAMREFIVTSLCEPKEMRIIGEQNKRETYHVAPGVEWVISNRLWSVSTQSPRLKLPQHSETWVIARKRSVLTLLQSISP